MSNLGRVKSLWLGKDKILKPGEYRRGYMKVGLCKEGERKNFKIHRLVMLVFVGESKLQVNHKNGIKTDNRLENLEYCTASENIQHSYDIGVRSKGENHSRSKLTAIEARKIKYEHKNMMQKEIAKIYGVSNAQVHMIRSGKSWKHI